MCLLMGSKTESLNYLKGIKFRGFRGFFNKSMKIRSREKFKNPSSAKLNSCSNSKSCQSANLNSPRFALEIKIYFLRLSDQ